jgi:para-nitrobenzyl esterase
MADAWIQFARTGDPNHPGIPQWTPFTPESEPTMIFDDGVRLVLNPDRPEQQIVEAAS